MILIWIIAIIFAAFAITALTGAPFVPLLGSQIDPILEALDLKPGQTLIDLGCGDGRLLKAAAKRGIKGIGFELNPWLFVWAKLSCLGHRRLIEIRFGNYWQAELPRAEGVFVFLIEHYMARLEQFLAAKLKQPTKVLSYVYKLPNRRPKRTGRNFYLYVFP